MVQVLTNHFHKLKRIAFPDLLNKQDLRKTMRERRRAMDARLSRYKSKQIAARALALNEVKRASTVALYASMPDEVCTDDIASTLLQSGVAVLYPVTKGNAIEFYKITSIESLSVQGQFGIREPDTSCCQKVDVQIADVILAPGVAFDVFGSRVGFGGGYYDRTLEALRNGGKPLAVGYAFGAQEVDALPLSPLDQPLDWVVTERGAIRCRP